MYGGGRHCAAGDNMISRTSWCSFSDTSNQPGRKAMKSFRIGSMVLFMILRNVQTSMEHLEVEKRGP